MLKKHVPPIKKYTVVRDTKEHEGHGWEWRASKYCSGTQCQSLATGDYTLAGLPEDYFVIERKGSVGEWAKNVVEKRFERELVRLDNFIYPFIILEFSVYDILNYPIGSGIPKYRWKYLRVRGPFILQRTMEIMTDHKVKILFCGDKGKDVAVQLFKRIGGSAGHLLS
jgi:hypothetical protein